MGALKTEFEFKLPVGYQDESGTLHKEGTMRLATAADEILPMRDPRVQQNPSYLSVILLSRVLTQLGPLDGESINTRIIEGLYAKDFSHLQDMYNRVNQNGADAVNTVCPKCNHAFQSEYQVPGE